MWPASAPHAKAVAQGLLCGAPSLAQAPAVIPAKGANGGTLLRRQTLEYKTVCCVCNRTLFILNHGHSRRRNDTMPGKSTRNIKQSFEDFDTDLTCSTGKDLAPVLFLSHGTTMLLGEDSRIRDYWRKLGKDALSHGVKGIIIMVCSRESGFTWPQTD